MTIQLVKHAQQRVQQRGFSPIDIDLILNFGDEQIHQKREIYTITKNSLKKMKTYFGKPNIANEFFARLRGAFLVIDGNNVITVSHKTKHAKRDRA